MAHAEYELRGQITKQQEQLEQIMIFCAKAGQAVAAERLGHAISNLVSAKAVLAYQPPTAEEKEQK